MHGRTAFKEIDPGRFLRLMRAGIAACSIDLPGHGERADERLQAPGATLEVIERMLEEIDSIIEEVCATLQVDQSRVAIGGMSAGGMVTLSRLTREHGFRAASVEATTGSWRHQKFREMFLGVEAPRIRSLDPIENLASWREIPIQAIHCRGDEWVSFEGQVEFLDELRRRYRDPASVELVSYDQCGSPFEHAGFGRMSADAKERQRDFFTRVLLGDASPGA